MVRNFHVAETVVMNGILVCLGCYNKYYSFGGLYEQKLISHSAGGHKSEIGMPAWSGSSDGSLLRCGWPASRVIFHWREGTGKGMSSISCDYHS